MRFSMSIYSQISNLRYARKNINHVCPVRIEQSDPRARLVTGQRRCPRVGFSYPDRKHMTYIINLAAPCQMSHTQHRASFTFLFFALSVNLILIYQWIIYININSTNHIVAKQLESPLKYFILE